MPFLLYKSSAGSGKTYTLVREYLKLALMVPENPAYFKNILAITFTNKAAQEMKARIIDSLEKISKGDLSEMGDEIITLLNKECEKKVDKNQLINRAKNVMEQILHNYSNFSVMTIDSFINKIVRGFSLELDIPINSSIDLNQEKILEKVVEMMLEDVGRSPELTNWMVDYITLQIDQEEGWNLDRELSKTGAEMLSEGSYFYLSDINRPEIDFKSLIPQIVDFNNHFKENIKELAKSILDFVQSSDLDIEDFAGKTATSIPIQCEKLLKAKYPDQFKLNRYFKEGKWYTQNSAPEFIEEIDFLRESGLEALRESVVQFMDANYKQFVTYNHVLKNIYSLSLLTKMAYYLDIYKKENQIIPISDLNRKVSEIISTDIIPFIYQNIGDKFHHYLIDEFQDTSRLQWGNLYPLIEESLSNNFSNLAVGDPKQAIYRWRGGDVEIITEKLPHQVRYFGLETKKLQVNYRSLKNIVLFNNDFFKNGKSFLRDYVDLNLLNLSYEDIEQTVKKELNFGGFVECSIYPKTKSNAEFYEKAIIKTLSIIEHVKKDYKHSEIAVVVRKNEEGRRVVRALFEKGIPVISSQSVLIYKEPVIGLLINILYYIANPENYGAKVRASYFYRVVMGSSLFETHPFHFLEEIKYQDRWLNILEEERHNLLNNVIYELVEKLIQLLKLQYQSSFTGFLQRFLDVVFDFQLRQSGNIIDFLDWWETNKEGISLNMPEDIDAIQVMTVEKSKGLEFPVVIVPFANWKISPPTGSTVWVKPDTPIMGIDAPILVKDHKSVLMESSFKASYSEEMKKVIFDHFNRIYVAYTRAKEQLYIITWDSTDGKKKRDIVNISDLIVPVIKKMSLMRESKGGSIQYFYGKDSRVIPMKTEGDGSRELKHFYSSSWGDKISISYNSKKYNYANPSNQEDIDYKNLILMVLKKIKSVNDIEYEVEKLYRDGIIDKKVEERLLEKVENITSFKLTENWFKAGNNILENSTIILKNKQLTGDRVIINENRDITIVNYITAKGELQNELSKNDKNRIMEYGQFFKDKGYNPYLYILQIGENDDKHNIIPIKF